MGKEKLMNVKRCEKCGCKWDEDVSPHTCPAKPKVEKPKTKKDKVDKGKADDKGKAGDK